MGSFDAKKDGERKERIMMVWLSKNYENMKKKSFLKLNHYIFQVVVKLKHLLFNLECKYLKNWINIHIVKKIFNINKYLLLI